MANPTTNYGFVLPTSSDLVTDLPADFDVALQGVDTRLKALQPGTTLGDLAYSSATANTNTRLGIGSTVNVLTVSGGVPVWSAPAGGGKLLQVVQGTLTSNATTTSGSFVDTGLEATITPSLASSKVMVIANYMAFSINSGASAASTLASMILLRTSTQLQGDSYGNYRLAASNAPEFYTRFAFSYLDSPATTSATTYKIQHKIVDCTSCGISASATKIASIILMEIGA